jgi:hypothetical protein
MFPERTITGKNAPSQQRTQSPKSPSNPKVLEVGSEDRLDVLRLSGDPNLLAQGDGRISVAIFLKSSKSVRKYPLGLERRDLVLEIIIADNALALMHSRCLFAAMSFGEAIILDIGVQSLEKEEGKCAQRHEEGHRHDEMPVIDACCKSLQGCGRGEQSQLDQMALHRDIYIYIKVRRCRDMKKEGNHHELRRADERRGKEENLGAAFSLSYTTLCGQPLPGFCVQPVSRHRRVRSGRLSAGVV